ncbi:MAG TPA: hypothetical protein VE597_10240 [Geminicoccaceae bacterium]|nr:hypothetical protein [Geminicoccaceae bacterium]
MVARGGGDRRCRRGSHQVGSGPGTEVGGGCGRIVVQRGGDRDPKCARALYGGIEKAGTRAPARCPLAKERLPRVGSPGMLLDLTPLSLWTVSAILAGAALVICLAGARLANLADTLADRSGMGEIIAARCSSAPARRCPG